MSGTLLKPLLSSTTVDTGTQELRSLVAIREEEPHTRPHSSGEKHSENFQRRQPIGGRHDRRYSAGGLSRGVTERVWRTKDDADLLKTRRHHWQTAPGTLKRELESSSESANLKDEVENRFESAQVINPLQLQYRAGDEDEFYNESFASNSMEVIIDGQHTPNSLIEGGFVSVKAAHSDMSISKALQMCTRYVINPFHIFLKVIGWRIFRSSYATKPPLHKRCTNVLYPAFIFIMLCVTSVFQVLSCFFRNREMPPVQRGDFQILDCSNNVVTSIVVSYFLILGAYLWGLYIFRYSESEHLASLSETAFLSFNYTLKSRKTPVFVLLSFLFSGILWVIFSLGASVLRLFALRLNDNTTIIGWFTNNLTSPDQINELKMSFEVYSILHYLFAIISIVGFIFFDLLYIAVVINYCSQCQLLIYYINNIKEKVSCKKYCSLADAAKDLNKMSEFLTVLNSASSLITTLMLYIFVRNVITSYAEMADDEPGDTLAAVVGFVNIIQWLIATAFPIIMATWLTSVGVSVRKLGLEVATRPFVYSETPDLELDIFLNFTSSSSYVAKLSFVPMYPALVGGFVFVIAVMLTSHVGIPEVQSVSWF